eukprot:8966208-Alexandrium_andersonii.AAC.1
MQLRAAVVHVKGDWSEFSHSLGFPTWQSNDYPCIWCDADRDSWFDLSGFSREFFGFRETTCADYEAACRRCEKWVQ